MNATDPALELVSDLLAADALAAAHRDAKARTLALVEDLGPEQLMGPRLAIVNPFLWEIGHVAWFHEHWILRGIDRRAPHFANADALYDSSAVPHDTRWDLPLPSVADTLAYAGRVHESLIERLERKEIDDRDRYFHQMTVLHEDMHDEAFTYMRQTLAYPRPRLAPRGGEAELGETGPHPGDVAIPGGAFSLGGARGGGFVFDNEKWAHTIELRPFRVARAPVTNAEFAAFVDDRGYERPELWSEEGWRWREQSGARHPRYWSRAARGWQWRSFDAVEPLAPHAPAIFVNWHEAEAWCRWAGRRLPSEAEWEAAAAGEPAADGGAFGAHKRRYPWGEAPPDATRANLDGWRLGTVDVAAHPAGDSAFGCRQMIGNVWEWTATTFTPYPGFVRDPYQEYSEPWFGSRKVLRGGGWATRGRLIRNTWRNFFTPERNDVFAGFRTCAP